MTEAEQERAAVVAWLRDRAEASGDIPSRICMNIASAIERGDHLKDKPNATR